MATAIIWRDVPAWLTREQCATSLGLSPAALERKVETGELKLECKPGLVLQPDFSVNLGMRRCRG
jgi:hypothetical protein